MSPRPDSPMDLRSEHGPLSSVACKRDRDPLVAIFGVNHPDWFAWATFVALVAHLLLVGSGLASDLLRDLRLAMEDNRARLHDYFWRQYEVEIPKEQPRVEEKVLEPPEPTPAPKPPPKALPKEDDPYKNLPPPQPAQAGKVLTTKEDPDEPQDLTGNTVVSGEGTSAYGMQSGTGKGDTPTMARNASLDGVAGGQGTGKGPAVAPAEDRSRSIGLAGGASWNCPFPPEADADEINQAVVMLQITVRPDGSAASATVVSDPGHGFGRAARVCALNKRYLPALDRGGNAILSSAPVNIRFSR